MVNEMLNVDENLDFKICQDIRNLFRIEIFFSNLELEQMYYLQ
jgi:hypothetical protein